MAGGWHIGDLSQSYWQTASATAAFSDSPDYKDENKRLSDRLIEEDCGV